MWRKLITLLDAKGGQIPLRYENKQSLSPLPIDPLVTIKNSYNDCPSGDCMIE